MGRVAELGSLGRNFQLIEMFNYPMKTLLKFSFLVVTASACLVGCATSPHGGRAACEYRLVRGVTDTGGLSDFEHQLNAVAKDGFTIHSTTLIPRTESQREQALIILERPVR